MTDAADTLAVNGNPPVGTAAAIARLILGATRGGSGIVVAILAPRQFSGCALHGNDLSAGTAIRLTMLAEDFLKEALYNALRETIETMAFAEVMPDEGNALNQMAGGADLVWGRVGIESREIAGAELVVPVELIASLSETMYASGTEQAMDVYLDTVAELANTLTGKFMLDLGDKAGGFVLQVPEKGAGLPDVAGRHLVCHCMVDETHPVRVVLFLR